MSDATRSNDITGAIPMVIAPWTYFMDLEDQTGDTTSTPESILRWALQGDGNRIEATKHLIVLHARPGSGAPRRDTHRGDDEAPFVDGFRTIDPAGPTQHDDVRLDYCAYCVRERGCGRLETVTSPHGQQDHGNGRITSSYECAYGHTWQLSWRLPASV